MSIYKNSVSYYTTGIASIKVHFPEDQVKCQWCEFLKNEQYANRNSCRLTGKKSPHLHPAMPIGLCRREHFRLT